VSLGGSWLIRNFHQRMAELKRSHSVGFVQLIHDIIPILYPSWTPLFGRAFHRWVRNVAGVSDMLLTISQQSRRDLELLAARDGSALPPVRTIRYGTGFPSGSSAAAPVRSRGQTSNVETLPERFILCVSSFETRKNHQLLVTVWRNLIAAHGS